MSTSQPKMRKPRLGVVIGSGGLKCSAALGMWRVLQREGIQVDMAVGCSGGSVFAAVMAFSRDLQEMERLNTEMWRIVFNRIYYPALFRGLLPQVFGFTERIGLMNDRLLNEGLKLTYGDATIEQAHIPLYLVACDLHTGEKIVMSEGRVWEAVRASMAIPVVLRPWPIGGRLLMDGGAVDPLPVSVAVQEGCDIILAMGFETPPEAQIGSIVGVVGQTIGIITNNLLKSTYAFYSMAHHAEVIPILPIFDRTIGFKDASLLPYVMEQGEKAAEAQMPYLKRLLEAGIPDHS